MLFFTSRGAPDPDGLILDAVGAARQRSRRLIELGAAGAHAARLLSRVRQDRRPQR